MSKVRGLSYAHHAQLNTAQLDLLRFETPKRALDPGAYVLFLAHKPFYSFKKLRTLVEIKSIETPSSSSARDRSKTKQKIAERFSMRLNALSRVSIVIKISASFTNALGTLSASANYSVTCATSFNAGDA